MDRAAAIRRLEQIQLEVIEDQYQAWRTDLADAGQPFPESLRKLIADAHKALIAGHQAMPDMVALPGDKERLLLQLEEEAHNLRRSMGKSDQGMELIQ